MSLLAFIIVVTAIVMPQKLSLQASSSWEREREEPVRLNGEMSLQFPLVPWGHACTSVTSFSWFQNATAAYRPQQLCAPENIFLRLANMHMHCYGWKPCEYISSIDFATKTLDIYVFFFYYVRIKHYSYMYEYTKAPRFEEILLHVTLWCRSH